MLKRVLLSICACAAFAAALSAQTGVGQIQGTITDTSGAVIPNAAVMLEHIQTENKFQTTTNAAGLLRVSLAADRRVSPGGNRSRHAAMAGQRSPGRRPARGNRLPPSKWRSPPSRSPSPAMSRRCSPPPAPPWPPSWSAPASSSFRSTAAASRPCCRSPCPGLEGSASQPKVYGLRDSAMDLVQDGVNLQDRNTGAIQSRPPGTRHHPGVPRGDRRIQRQAEPPGQRHHDHAQRHQRCARFGFPHRPQQRLRRRAPAAGHLHQGPAPGAQRVRRLARRAGVSSPRSTTAGTAPSSSPPGKRCATARPAPPPPPSGPTPCARAISAA